MTLAEQLREEGRLEGRLEGIRQIILQNLIHRFGKASERLAEALDSVSAEDGLLLLIRASVRAASVEEFQATLRETSPIPHGRSMSDGV